MAIKAVDKFFDRGGWCLCFSGRPGVGKSFAAGYWLWRRAEQLDRKPCPIALNRWYSSGQIASVSAYDPEFQGMLNLPSMVIDDLGVEYLDRKGNYASKLDHLIDHRYGEERPTVLTTNLGVDAFRQRYGERIYRRITQDGFFVQITDDTATGKPPRGAKK